MQDHLLSLQTIRFSKYSIYRGYITDGESPMPQNQLFMEFTRCKLALDGVRSTSMTLEEQAYAN